MQISTAPPMTRGVTELMYVGDTPEIIIPATPINQDELALGALGLLIAFGTSGLTRLGGLGIAAWAGYRAYVAVRTGVAPSP
jgi:hypothetical protein